MISQPTPSQWARHEYCQALRDIRDVLSDDAYCADHVHRSDVESMRAEVRRKLVAEVRKSLPGA